MNEEVIEQGIEVAEKTGFVLTPKKVVVTIAIGATLGVAHCVYRQYKAKKSVVTATDERVKEDVVDADFDVRDVEDSEEE